MPTTQKTQTTAVRSELLSRADRAPDALTLFAEASAQLRRLVPHDAAVWRATDPATGLMTAPVRAENTDERGCWDYWETEFFDEKVNLFTDLARAPVPVAALWESTGGEPQRAAVYRQFMRPRGLGDELRAVLRADGLPHGHISLFRTRGRTPFTPAEARLVAGLTAPLARRLRSYAGPAPRPVGGTAPGLLLFDAADRLVSANDEARRRLADLPEGPAVPTDLGLDVPAWLHTVALQAHAAGPGAAEPRIRLRTRSGQWLVCHASRLRGTGGTHGTSGAQDATAVVIEPAASSEIAPLLAAAYELTAREVEITHLVARGLPTEQIATELFLSPHTVRDHIKAIFDKTGVSTRGALVGKLFMEHYEPVAAPQPVRVRS